MTLHALGDAPLRSLFRGGRVVPEFGDRPPPAYDLVFAFIERPLALFAAASVPTVRDAEFEKPSDVTTRIVEIGERRRADGQPAARRIADSALCKCSWYGEDPYWGRLASEAGSACNVTCISLPSFL